MPNLGDVEAAGAQGEQVETAIWETLIVRNAGQRADWCGYLVLVRAAGQRECDAERRAIRQAIADHLAVPRLKNVQRQRHAWEEHEAQRKQRDLYQLVRHMRLPSATRPARSNTRKRRLSGGFWQSVSWVQCAVPTCVIAGIRSNADAGC